MFCSECGKKCKEDDLFCDKCGNKLKEVPTKKPMSKKNKIFLGIVLILVVVLGGTYKVLSDRTSPKAIANEYMEALSSNDPSKMYKFLEVSGDDTFISEKVYNNLFADEKLSDYKIENYKIGDVTYGSSKITAKVEVNYTTDVSSEEITEYLDLNKAKAKKYIFFDNWKITSLSAGNTIVTDYFVSVPEGAEVTYAGIKVDSKYLNKDLSSEGIDLYVLPQVFEVETKVEAKLKNGLVITSEVTPSNYGEGLTLELDEETLGEENEKVLADLLINTYNTIYNGALQGKTFDDIKSELKNLSSDTKSIEEEYNELLSSLGGSTSALLEIDFMNPSVYDIDIEKNGDIEITFRVSYKFELTYTDWTGEESTYDGTNTTYTTLVVAYNNGSFEVKEISDLIDNFSRY